MYLCMKYCQVSNTTIAVKNCLARTSKEGFVSVRVPVSFAVNYIEKQAFITHNHKVNIRLHIQNPKLLAIYKNDTKRRLITPFVGPLSTLSIYLIVYT